jgi:YkoY family integral membrane protein
MVTLILLFITLAFLEIMLSGDNAVVLASMARRLHDPDKQSKALNIGMTGSYILRVLVIIFGVWLFSNPILGPAVKILGAVYLLYLTSDFFSSRELKDKDNLENEYTFWNVVISITLADLAFSLDSATTALALSDNIYIILGACLTGVISLRFLAGWFIELIEKFEYLEAAGFIAVGLVGIQLLIKVLLELEIPELFNIGLIVATFVWGFSKRTEETI